MQTHGANTAMNDLQAVVTTDEVMALIEAVRTVHLALTLQGYMVDLAEASRRHPALLLGLSPRATLQLSRATRAPRREPRPRVRDARRRQGRRRAGAVPPRDAAPRCDVSGCHRHQRHPRDRRLRARTRRSLDDHPPRLDSDCRRGRASFAIGRVFGLIELYVVGVGIVIALLVALISVQRRLPPLNVKRIVSPAMVSVGEPARVDIQLANYGRQASPYLQLWEPVGNNGGAPMQLAKLGPGHAASAAYRVPTARRGLDPHRPVARAASRRAWA